MRDVVLESALLEIGDDVRRRRKKEGQRGREGQRRPGEWRR